MQIRRKGTLSAQQIYISIKESLITGILNLIYFIQQFDLLNSTMANRRTINDVINPGYNTTYSNTINAHNNFQNQHKTYILGQNRQSNQANRSILDLRAENDRLKLAISQWKEAKPVIVEQVVQEGGIPEQFNKRIAFNQEKIRDLNEQVKEQEQVIKAYKVKFAQFQDNLNKLMRLDKDIHTRLVNPEQSTILQRNVKNVMLALNSGASYADVAKMIQSIKV